MAKDKLKMIEKRKACLDKVRELQEAINDPNTLNAFTESMWDMLHDHLKQDQILISRYQEYATKYSQPNG